jgi:NADH/F420H2 dehydrogenase subunit C
MSTISRDELQALIASLDSELTIRDASSTLSFKAPSASLLKIMTALKNDPRLQFDMLNFHTALDWPTENRIEALYMLVSSSFNFEVQISVSVERENPVLDSVCRIWPIAEWQEREVYDMFGVTYQGHPDLRRIFLDDDWQGFPLRKDYQDEFVLRRPW